MKNIEENEKYRGDRRLIWLDVFKFFACLLVFWGHFFEVFIYKNNNFTLIDDNILSVFMGSIINGNFWVAAFCLISGYLCAFYKPSRICEVFKYCIRRYLKFVIAIALTLMFVVAIKYTIGFNTKEFPDMLACSWGGYYQLDDFSLINYLKFIFLFSDTLDGPIWMLHPLIASNCLIVTLNYLNKKIKHVLECGAFAFTVVTIIASAFELSSIAKYLYVLESCLCGAIINEMKDKLKSHISSPLAVFLCITIFCMLAFLHNLVFVNLLGINVFKLKIYSVFYILYASILYIVLLIGIDNDKMKRSKFIRFSQCSLPIYLLHWPVLCSFGSLFLLAHRLENYNFVIIVLFLLLNILVVLFSLLYAKIYRYVMLGVSNITILERFC